MPLIFVSLGIILLTYTAVIFFAYSSEATNASSHLKVMPQVVEISVTDDQVGRPVQRSLQITSNNTNITEIMVQFSDLQSDDISKTWVHRTALNIKPNNFSIAADQITELDVLINLPNQTGIYNGTMKLSSADGLLKTIPIRVVIVENFPIIFLIIAAVGVCTAFIVKYMKLRMHERDSALSSLDKLEDDETKARLEDRLDQRFIEGVDEAVRGLKYLKKGEYSQAGRIFDVAAEYFRSATKEQAPGLQKQLPKKTIISDLVDEARAEKGLRSSFRKSDNLLFLLSSVILGVVIIQTWIQIYPQLMSLANTGLAAISAFVLGYGSQSLLGEVVELTRKQ